MALARGVAPAMLLLACASTEVRTVPTGPHPSVAKPIEVDYPPPPAKVEEVTTPPRPSCAWRDGYWDWVGRRWDWVPGVWVVPPPGCYYAPHVGLVWLPEHQGSRLFYTQPRWYRSGGGVAGCDEPAPCAR